MLPTRKKKSSANAGSGGSALSTADQAKKTEEDEIEQLKKELEFEQKVIMTNRSLETNSGTGKKIRVSLVICI